MCACAKCANQCFLAPVRTIAAEHIHITAGIRCFVKTAKYLFAKSAGKICRRAGFHHWAWPMTCGRGMHPIAWRSRRSPSWKPFARAHASQCWHVWLWRPDMWYKSKRPRQLPHSTLWRTWPGTALGPVATHWPSHCRWRTCLARCRSMLQLPMQGSHWSCHEWVVSLVAWLACCWRPTRREQPRKKRLRAWSTRLLWEERCGAVGKLIWKKVFCKAMIYWTKYLKSKSSHFALQVFFSFFGRLLTQATRSNKAMKCPHASVFT